jgi:hypothetical protein
MKHAAKGGVVLAAANLCMNRRKEGIWQFAKAGYAAAAKNAKQNRKTSISKYVFDGSVVVAIRCNKCQRRSTGRSASSSRPSPELDLYAVAVEYQAETQNGTRSIKQDADTGSAPVAAGKKYLCNRRTRIGKHAHLELVESVANKICLWSNGRCIEKNAGMWFVGDVAQTRSP